jgi:hypothetical protein
MKTIIGLLFSIMLLSGCVEKNFNAKGAEALIYPELHRYSYSLKSLNHKDINNDLARITQQARSNDRYFTVTYLFNTNAGKEIAIQQISQNKIKSVLPNQFSMKKSIAITGDLDVVIVINKLLTEKCKPSRIEQNIYRKDCYVESMRMKQIANLEHVVGE